MPAAGGGKSTFAKGLCGLVSTDGSLQIGFGYDLYMYVASTAPCEQAVAEALRDGLWIDTDCPPVWWEEDRLPDP